MLDRPRLVLLGWALLSFALFGVVTLAVVQGWGPVDQFDRRGDPASEWAVDSGPLRHTLRVVEVGFETLGIAIMTAAVAVLLLLRGHRRAAIYTVGVMVATTIAANLVKALVGRARDDAQYAIPITTARRRKRMKYTPQAEKNAATRTGRPRDRRSSTPPERKIHRPMYTATASCISRVSVDVVEQIADHGHRAAEAEYFVRERARQPLTTARRTRPPRSCSSRTTPCPLRGCRPDGAQSSPS